MSSFKRRLFVAIFLLFALNPLRADTKDEHEVSPDQPVSASSDLFYPPVRLSAENGVIDHGFCWGHASPWIVDVDGDGLRDLVVGDFSGLFRVYRNLGTNQAPRYAKAVNLQAGGVDAKVPIY
jgi:hypothetical protein